MPSDSPLRRVIELTEVHTAAPFSARWRKLSTSRLRSRTRGRSHMAHESPKRIRNVALVGHRGSGKTSVNEALLFEAGAVNRLGSVADGTTVSDSASDEKSREMSISASLSSFRWDDRKINLIDTPGEPSWRTRWPPSASSRAPCSSPNGVMGAEVTTSRLWERASELGLARPLREHARPRARRLLPYARVAQAGLRPARRGDRDPDRQGARAGASST